MGISSIRCRRWFSEFPTTPLPQPVAKNNHSCYLNIFRSPSSLFLYSSFSQRLKVLVLCGSLIFEGARLPSHPQFKGVAANRHTLLSIESKSLNVVVRLSRVRMPTRSQSRLQGGGVDRPLPPARPTAWQPLTAASDCDLLLHSPEVARTLLSRRLRTNRQQLLSLESGIKSENNICALKTF